jgi:tetratricopeptide (TPR) repeat protein
MLLRLFLPFILFLLSGCVLPRIVVLDDILSQEEHLKLGISYEEKNEYDLAIREYQSALEHFPIAHLYLANTYFLCKEYVLSEKHYKEAIRRLPENPRPYNNLAWLYFTQRIKLDEAETLARKAIKLAPPGEAGVYLDTLEKIQDL